MILGLQSNGTSFQSRIRQVIKILVFPYCLVLNFEFLFLFHRYLRDSYKQGRVINDPYELVKDFCIDGGTEACANVKIPSVQRKLEEIKKLKEL